MTIHEDAAKDMLTATDEERDIIARYTKRQPCIVEDQPDAQTVWLVVDQQSFCLNLSPCNTVDEANWTRHMLAKALLKIIARAKAAGAETMREECKQAASSTKDNFSMSWNHACDEIVREIDRLEMK